MGEVGPSIPLVKQESDGGRKRRLEHNGQWNEPQINGEKIVMMCKSGRAGYTFTK